MDREMDRDMERYMERDNHPQTEQLACQECHHHDQAVRRLREEFPREEELQGTAELFKVFGDITRIKILTALLEGERCVCDISQLLGISQSAVSHQLRLLRSSHLVKNRREGKSIIYSLDDGHVATILAQGLEHIRHGSPVGGEADAAAQERN